MRGFDLAALAALTLFFLALCILLNLLFELLPLQP